MANDVEHGPEGFPVLPLPKEGGTSPGSPDAGKDYQSSRGDGIRANINSQPAPDRPSKESLKTFVDELRKYMKAKSEFSKVTNQLEGRTLGSGLSAGLTKQQISEQVEFLMEQLGRR